MQWRVVSVSVSLVVGAGCALIDPTPADAPIPTGKGLLGRACPSGGPTADPLEGHLTLERAVAVALENNPGLAANRWELAMAESAEDAAWAGVLPRLDANARFTHHLNKQPLIAIGGNPSQSRFARNIATGDVVLFMPLFSGGRVISEIRAAKLLARAAQHTLSRTRNELIFNVSSVFYSLLAQERVIESLEFSRQTLEKHLKRVVHLIANEKATRADRLRTEVRLADVRQELALARHALVTKRRTLLNLMGTPRSGERLELNGELEFESEKLRDLQEAVAVALGQRQDFRAARTRLEAQARKADAARGEHWPTLALEGAYGGRWDVTEIEDPEDAGRLGVALRLPLFEGNRVWAKVKQARFKLAVERERLRQLGLTIQLEVETARSNVLTARERVLATRTAIEQGKESLRIALLLYEAQKASITDVLDAQAELLKAQTSYFGALASHLVARVDLELAMGKMAETR